MCALRSGCLDSGDGDSRISVRIRHWGNVGRGEFVDWVRRADSSGSSVVTGPDHVGSRLAAVLPMLTVRFSKKCSGVLMSKLNVAVNPSPDEERDGYDDNPRLWRGCVWECYEVRGRQHLGVITHPPGSLFLRIACLCPATWPHVSVTRARLAG